MKFNITILLLFLMARLTGAALPELTDVDFENYVKEGTRQYRELLEYNRQNTAEGCEENNWYIFSFNPEDNWLEVSKNGKDFDGNVIYNLDALNAINNELLVPFNANSDLDVQLYICIVSDWFIPVKAQHPEVLINNPNPAIKTQELMLELSTADEKTYKSFVHTSFDLILKSILDNSHQANTQSLYSKEKRVVWGQAEFRSNFFFGQQELSGGLVKRYRGDPELEVLVDVDELKEYTQYVSLHRTYENFNLRETKIRHIVEGFTEFVGGDLDEQYVPIVDKLKFESLQFIPWNTIPDHLKNTGGGSATYDAAVDMAVEEVNARIEINELLSPLNEDLYLKYIINHTTTDFSKESSKKLNQLDDKFAYLDHRGGAKYYVYFKKVDFVMPPEHYNVFANEIFVESGLNEMDNAVLITLPYLKPYEENGVFLSNYTTIMPGIAHTANLLGSEFADDVAEVFVPGAKFWEFIKVAFKHTPKPLRVHGVTLLLGDGRNDDHSARLHIQDLTPPEMTGFVTGFFNMNEIYLYRDDRIDMVRELESQMLNSCMQAADFGEIDFTLCEDLVNDIQAVYDLPESEYGYTKLEYDFNIKEKYLDPEITDLWAGGQYLVKYSILEFKNADRWFDHWWTEFNPLENEGVIYNTEAIELVYDALDALSLVPVIGEFADVGILLVGAADTYMNGASERSVVAVGTSALGFFMIGENYIEIPLKNGRKLFVGPCVGFVTKDAVAAGTDPVLVKKIFNLESSAPGSTAKKLVDNITEDGRRLHQVILENDKLWDILRLMPKQEKRKLLEELSENPKLLSELFDQSSLTMKPVDLWRKINGLESSLAKTAIRNLDELDKIDFYNHLDTYGNHLLDFVSHQTSEIDVVGCWNSIKNELVELGTNETGLLKAQSLLTDLKNNLSLVDHFTVRTTFVKAWEVLYGQGDEALIGMRSNWDNLDKVDEYLFEYPDNLADLQIDFILANNKQEFVDGLLGPGVIGGPLVSHKVRGLYDDISVEDDLGVIVTTTYGSNGLLSKVEAEVGSLFGFFVRNYFPDQNLFVFNMGFLKDAPKWLDNGLTPLVTGKGIPTQMLVTLRQMKMFGIPDGSLTKAKLSTIQNARTMLEVTKRMMDNNWTSLDQFGNEILNVPSVNYAISCMKQAGYRIPNASVLGDNVQVITPFEAATNFEIEEMTQELLDEYGFNWQTPIYVNFDIFFDLQPF